MNRTTQWIIGIVVIAAIAVGVGVAVSKNSSNKTNPSPAPTAAPSQKSTNSSASTPQNKSEATEAEIHDMAFSPASLSVKMGSTVTWTNKDSIAHTVTSDSGSELSSGTIAPGGTFSHTFHTAGTFKYHCSIHPNMTGAVTVTQ